MKPKVAITVSHPIQHFCPQYVSYAKSQEWETKVFFASALGCKPFIDKDFNQEVEWKGLGLEQFAHKFLNNGEVITPSSDLRAQDLGKELKEFKPDVLIVYGYIQKFQREAVNWAKRHKKKVFFIADSERMRKRPFYKELAKLWILRKYFRKVDRFLTVGNANEHYYGLYGIRLAKMTRVGFPVDISAYKDAFLRKEELKKEIRSHYQINAEEVVLSVVGKIVHSKRQLDLLKLANLLENRTNKKFVIFIIGSGPQQEELEAFAREKILQNKVIFTGFIPPERLISYYAATDIYVHPSEVDAHSLAISEAIYMGCPAIISNRCGSYGPTDDVQEGKNGFVYPCGDIEALLKYVLKLADNQTMRESFGKYSHQFAVASQANAHGSGLKAALVAENLL